MWIATSRQLCRRRGLIECPIDCGDRPAIYHLSRFLNQRLGPEYLPHGASCVRIVIETYITYMGKLCRMGDREMKRNESLRELLIHVYEMMGGELEECG